MENEIHDTEIMEVIPACDSGHDTAESSISRSTSFSEDYNTVVNETFSELSLSDDDFDEALKQDVVLNIYDDQDTCMSRTFDKNATVMDVTRELVDDDYIDNYDLTLNGRQLPRNITLRDAGVISGSRINLVEREFPIEVRLGDGKIYPLTVRASETVENAKQRFFNAYQIPVHQQSLTFNSKELENGKTLKSYKIKAGSKLQAVLRLRGGF